MNKIVGKVKNLTVQAVALLLATTGLVTGVAQFTYNSPAKADDFMNTYFRDGQVIKLVTPKGYNVNLPSATNGGMINTFEPDGTDEWKFVVIRTKNGVKFKRINTNHLITSKKFPSSNLELLEAYNDVGGEDIATAKAVRTLREAHLPLHPEDSRIELVVYGFDSSTMTNIAQFC